MVPAHLEMIDAVDRHDFTGVLWKTREDLRDKGERHPDEYYEQGIEALKRYYLIAGFDGDNPHALSDKVDPFWHSHILFTEDYDRFCRKTMGAFMHHDPLDHRRQHDVRHVQRLYRYTMRVYGQCFVKTDCEFEPETLPAHRVVCTHRSMRHRRFSSGVHGHSLRVGSCTKADCL
jgi:hypothetical protein